MFDAWFDPGVNSPTVHYKLTKIAHNCQYIYLSKILLLIFDSYFKGKMDFLIFTNDYFFAEISQNSVCCTLVQNN